METFEALNTAVKGKDLVMALGKKKTGLSTWLSYCANGPAKHHSTTVKVEDAGEAELVDKTVIEQVE